MQAKESMEKEKTMSRIISEKVQRKIDNGMQYRALSDVAPTGEYIVEGYATTFNQPYVLYQDNWMTIREQIDPGAFDECDMSDVVMLYDHEGRVYARNKNNTLGLGVDKVGLKTRGDLSGTQLGREIYDEISKKYTDKMSMGFVIEEDRRETKEENGKYEVLRTITKIRKLYDVSAVSIPANDYTSISSRGFVDGVINEIKAERLEQEKREKQKQRIKILAMCK